MLLSMKRTHAFFVILKQAHTCIVIHETDSYLLYIVIHETAFVVTHETDPCLHCYP